MTPFRARNLWKVANTLRADRNGLSRACIKWLILAGLLVANGSLGQNGPSAQEPDFSPPPVPDFMLRTPAKPLTLEEMQQQAEAAARRARAEKDRRALPPQPPAQTGSEGIK